MNTYHGQKYPEITDYILDFLATCMTYLVKALLGSLKLYLQHSSLVNNVHLKF